MGSSCDLIEDRLRGQYLPVRDFNQSTGLLDRRFRTSLILQVLSLTVVTDRVCCFLIWLRGQGLAVRVFNQFTGLIDRRSRMSLTLQVLVSSCERRATLSGLAKPRCRTNVWGMVLGLE